MKKIIIKRAREHNLKNIDVKKIGEIKFYNSVDNIAVIQKTLKMLK
jgi:hypothetical protein